MPNGREARGTGANTYSTFNDHASVCVLTCEYVRRRCVSRRKSLSFYEKAFYERLQQMNESMNVISIGRLRSDLVRRRRYTTTR